MFTNFSRCAEINDIVGNTATRDLTHLKAQLKLIKDEVKEMEDSLEIGDLDQLRDDVADVLFTTYGMGHRAGFNVDIDFAIVCLSQMSKFDFNEEDRLKTEQKYLELGVKTYYSSRQLPNGARCFVTYSFENQTGKDGKFYPAGKYLKSVNFQEPTFPALQPIDGVAYEEHF